MTAHLTEEDLILLHYGEVTPEGTAQHVAECPVCQQEAARLDSVLALVDLPVDEPAPDWDEKTWARLGWRLRGENRPVRRNTRLVGTAAALVVAGLLGWLWGSRPMIETSAPTAAPQIAATPVPSGRDRVLLVVVSDHLERTERVLLELSNLPSDDAVRTRPDRKRADELVAANRLYRHVAADKDPKLEALLEQIEPVLLEIARAPSSMTAGDVRALQKRISDNGLILKLRVSGARVRNQQRSSGPTT